LVGYLKIRLFAVHEQNLVKQNSPPQIRTKVGYSINQCTYVSLQVFWGRALTQSSVWAATRRTTPSCVEVADAPVPTGMRSSKMYAEVTSL